MNEKLCGVFSPLNTIFDDDESLNVKKLSFNIKRYAASGIRGYLVLGSNGENKSLSEKEKEAVLDTVLYSKGAEQVVMVGSIYESTAMTISFARRAANMGADFITLLPPCYFKKMMTEETLLRYFQDVASAVDAPCLLYNAPQYAGGVVLSPALIRACAEHPNIVGVKDSSTALPLYAEELSSIPDFSLLSGSAGTFIKALDAGAIGGVISLANSMPKLVQSLYDCYREGKRSEAAALNEKIIQANRVISGRYGVAGVKEAMRLNGFYGGIPRRPLLPLSVEEKEDVARAVAEIVDFSETFKV